MALNKAVSWRLASAVIALSAAVAVYSLARLQPPALLQPLKATQTALLAHPGLFGSLPSLLFTLAMGLLLAVFAGSPAAARLHCSLWTGLALLLELTQHPLVAAPLADRLPGFVHESIWATIGPYWTRGVFDPVDLLATLAGGAIALLLIATTSR
jgi:hypothetical protein